jgi:hypothetical protein
MPDTLVKIPVGRGTASGIDPSLAQELQESVGVVYDVSNPAAKMFPGRTAFTTSIAASNVNDVTFLDAGSTQLVATLGSAIYGVNATTATATHVGDFPTSTYPDMASLADIGYMVGGGQRGATSPFGAYALRNSDLYRLGLYPQFVNPIATIGGGGNVSGTVYYWTTEYDSVHKVEGAFEGTPSIAGPGGVPSQITVNRPAVSNASADKWRIYRTIDGGAFPIGWLVAEVAIATTSYVDNLSDATLVLNDPYRIVTIDGLPESMDGDPQDLGSGSITSFQGSLVFTTTVGGDFAFTPPLEPHSVPESYRITCPTLYAGQSTCVRATGSQCYGSFPSELFLINYLPDETDAVFDSNICVEKVGNFGTPSPTGMCFFSAWGGRPILFVASLHGPMLVVESISDRAVSNIDWPNTVSLDQGRPVSWKCVDRPDLFRVEFYFKDATDAWNVLHFYYDSERLTQKTGPLPELAWTGPHRIPGRGTFGYRGVTGQTPSGWTGSSAGDGIVYLEDQGTVDNAHLIDGSGTINFRLRTPRIYPYGQENQGVADRVYIHSAASSTQDYTAAFTAYKENGQSYTKQNITISAAGAGLQSHDVNMEVISCDVRITADGTTGMAPINNVLVKMRDVAPGQKTTIVNRGS